MNARLDEIRSDALDQADRAARATKVFLVIAALWEAALLVAFVLLADWGDRLHVLLFVTALLVYGTIGLGLVTLGAYTRAQSLRVLKGVETLAGRD